MMFSRVFLAAALSVAFASAASAETVHYVARLDASKEVPKSDSKGTGTLEATYDSKTKELSYTLTFDGLTGPATAAHFHGPAPHGQNAAVVGPAGEKNPASPVSGVLTLTDEQAKELKASKIYVNVHTAANSGGEIRGQVIRVPAKKKAKAEQSA
jgi:hypothetical protein